MKRYLAYFLLLLAFGSSYTLNPVAAQEFGVSGGLTLQQSSARALALGEAFTTATDDISAMNYNPASLGTLKTPHMAFTYEQGLIEDSAAQVMLGFPFRSKAVLGFRLDYYDGGKLEIDNGDSVSAQRDLVLSLGSGVTMKRVSVGITGKFLSSTLAEAASAHAFAFDVGWNTKLTRALSWGTAFQNLGTPLRYVDKADPLPHLARTGLSYSFFPAAMSQITLFVDASYYINEKLLQPAVGLETNVGLLSFRCGYKKEPQDNEFSVGTGIAVGPSMLDYAFGLTGQETKNKISFSLRFGKQAPRFK